MCYHDNAPVSINSANKGFVNPVRETACPKPSGSKNFGGLLAQKKEGSGKSLRGPAFTKGAARMTSPISQAVRLPVIRSRYEHYANSILLAMLTIGFAWSEHRWRYQMGKRGDGD